MTEFTGTAVADAAAMRNLLASGLVVLMLSSLALGCGGNEPPPAKDPGSAQLNQTQQPLTQPTTPAPIDPVAQSKPTQQPMNDPAMQKPTMGGEEPGGNKVLAKTEKPMTDAEIIGVVMTVNDGEIQMAEQAIKKAKNADAKNFALMMKTHHGQGLAKTKSLETKTKITKAESDLTAFLKSDVEKTMKDLQNKEGKDFDKGYMDAQVTAHKAVLTAIDNRLVPGAQNSEVKALVAETRKTVTDHIAKAEEVQKKVDTMASNDTDFGDKATTTSSSKAKTEKGVEPRP